MSQAFCYKSLDTPTAIRLLRVNLEENIQEYTFELEEFDLAETRRPEYFCLSYTWDKPTPKYQEQLDEYSGLKRTSIKTSEGSIQIGSNLNAFIGELCNKGCRGPAYIWIDAVCIDQSNLEERAAQVRLMGQIYKRCKETIVWLGPEDETDKDAIDLIERMKACEDVWYDPVEGHRSWDPAIQQKMGVELIPAREWLALGRLLDRNWFHRTWTLQEFVLPPDVVFWYGDKSFRLGELLVAVALHGRGTILEGMVLPETDDLGAVVATKGSLMPRRAERNFHEIRNTMTAIYRRLLAGEDFDRMDSDNAVDYSRVRQCADMRDSVYGLLGICPSEMPVSYKKPVSEVYLDFVRAHGPGKFIPYAVENRKYRQVPGLPSWVPDFSVRQEPDPWVSTGGGGVFSAGGTRKHEPYTVEVFETQSPRVLAISVVFVDVIRLVVRESADFPTGKFLIDSLAALDTLTRNAYKGDMMEAFWRSLIAGSYGSSQPKTKDWELRFSVFLRFHLAKWIISTGMQKDNSYQLRNTLDSLRRKTGSCLVPEWDGLVELSEKLRDSKESEAWLKTDEYKEMSKYEEHFRRRFQDRCFFVTELNRIGIGPDYLVPGCKVCVVRDVDYPLLFEEVDRAGARYRFAGYGYVHGIMDGSTFKEELLTRIEIE